MTSPTPDAAKVTLAERICEVQHPDSTWVCDPQAVDPRNRIAACYACQRVADALAPEFAAREAKAAAKAWDEGHDASDCKCGHSVFAHPSDDYRNCRVARRGECDCTGFEPVMNPYRELDPPDRSKA